MTDKWKDFKKAVKKARELSKEYYGFRIFPEVRVSYSEDRELKAFDLNPHRVNLKTGKYGKEYNVIGGKEEFVKNLKEVMEDKDD